MTNRSLPTHNYAPLPHVIKISSVSYVINQYAEYVARARNLIIDYLYQYRIASIPADSARIVVYDLAGHVVADKAQATPAEAVSGLAKGVYVVKIIAANSISTYKVQL